MISWTLFRINDCNKSFIDENNVLVGDGYIGTFISKHHYEGNGTCNGTGFGLGFDIDACAGYGAGNLTKWFW